MSSDWDKVSNVISSRYRVAALERPAAGPATPSTIASDQDLLIAHISRALQTLQDADLVTLLVSEDRRKGRVYGLTDTGEDVWETIQAENMVKPVRCPDSLPVPISDFVAAGDNGAA
jgi:DNA-binding MarR family transcriptional regulator